MNWKNLLIVVLVATLWGSSGLPVRAQDTTAETTLLYLPLVNIGLNARDWVGTPFASDMLIRFYDVTTNDTCDDLHVDWQFRDSMAGNQWLRQDFVVIRYEDHSDAIVPFWWWVGGLFGSLDQDRYDLIC